ncbi:MAG: SBBP repeat-containing protein [bacterium]
MKTFTISYLLVALMAVAFVHAQDFIEQEYAVKRHRFDNAEMAAFPKQFFQSQENSRNWLNPATRFHKRGERWQNPLGERGFMGRGARIDSKFSLSSRQTQHGSASEGAPAPAVTLSGNIQEAWMRHYGSGLVPAYDVATAMTTDASGNVYVTGYSTTRSFGDYFTAKYNAAGVQVWSARYNGIENGDDWAFAIAVDVSGNVYATGHSYDSATNYDYATIKYNSAGMEEWVARYNGPGNFDDYAIALAVDAAGNVYVTGRSLGSGTQYDYATVKYNSAGAEQWVSRYNGPGNADDVVCALSGDDTGNVYVTGYSYGSGTGADYATVKYNSAGAEQWVSRLNGPGNLDDVAHALAVDDSGNVYVTGSAYDVLTGYDYTTVKYSATGAEQWIARYNGSGNPPHDFASFVTVDGPGNVYVTGYSTSGGITVDYATIKYNSAGAERWVSRYNGQGNFDDVAYALAVDLLGNVYVTGVSGDHPQYDYATVKYDSAGAEQWVSRYNGPGNSGDDATAIAVDPAGNVLVTGYSFGPDTDFDYATVKYNSAGAEQWIARYNGLGNSDDHTNAIVVDPAGNVYVTGYSYGSSPFYDYATIKYDATGTEQWVVRYNGPGNSDDRAIAITLDPAGNVYVTGSSFGAGPFFDYATIKYNSAGTEQWVARYNGPGNGSDEPCALAVDAAGNVYVTGLSAGSGTRNDYATIKYNSAGTEEWVVRYNSPANSTDNASALAVDAAGNVYVTGHSQSRTAFDLAFDYATIKYNSAGEEQWVARYDGPGGFDDFAVALALDPAGEVYVTGYGTGSDTGDDYATVKYNSAGAEQWVARYNGPGNSTDHASMLAVDPAGNVYVTGWSSGSGSDYATVKYNSAGAEQWIARYNGPVNDFNFASALALDATGNVYVTGYSVGSGTSGDYTTIKYNSSGAEEWIARSDGPGHPDDYAHDLAVDLSGNVYVTGSSYEANSSWALCTTIKYNQNAIASSVNTINGEAPVAFELGSNYPNPFNPETTIQYTISAQAGGSVPVTLRIYNLQGQLMRTLVDGQQPPGRYRVVWDGRNGARVSLSAGVYLYTLTAGHFKAAKKLTILK